MPDKKEMTEAAKAAMAGMVMGGGFPTAAAAIGAKGLKKMGEAGGETGKKKPKGLSKDQIQKMDPPKPEMNYGGPSMSHLEMKYDGMSMHGKGPHMESAKQERKNLMKDNPVAKDASGGRNGSWMSKHSQSRMGGSPLGKHCM